MSLLGQPALRGTLVAAGGNRVSVAGLSGHLAVGDRVRLESREGQEVTAEVVTLQDAVAHALCHGHAEGLGLGAGVVMKPGSAAPALAVCGAWVGRVVDAAGAPLDALGKLPVGLERRPLRAAPPPATARGRLGPRLDLGVAALDLFATCRQGQRLGLFAGSGVGKSTLLSMLARNTACDVAVLALVGERGREVREFLEDDLGPDGRARCVTVVATSDESPLRRRDAAHAAMAVAEYFRDEGKSVLLLMDSVTRYCLALREVALAAGEPPAARGWPPSVFAELPRLLERAGPGLDGPQLGQITALFTVLVDGDDHDEPVADAVRGILDGHVVLDRGIAERGRYPAVDVLRSLSRTVPGCLDPGEWEHIRAARAALAHAAEMADLIRLGAYQTGRDPTADAAIAAAPKIEALISQLRHDHRPRSGSFAALAALGLRA